MDPFGDDLHRETSPRSVLVFDIRKCTNPGGAYLTTTENTLPKELCVKRGRFLMHAS